MSNHGSLSRQQAAQSAGEVSTSRRTTKSSSSPAPSRASAARCCEVLRDRSRVIIEGVNFIKKASRKSQEQPQGGIIEREGALHISKVMLAADYDSRKGSKPAETESAKPAKKAAPKAKK